MDPPQKKDKALFLEFDFCLVLFYFFLMNHSSASDAPESFLFYAEHLSQIYADGQVKALVDVNLGIRKGEFVTIMGPSGSGKSTLLSLLGGLDRPSKGTVFFEGRPLSAYGNLDQYRAFKIGFVFQSFLLLPTLTAVENVQVPLFEGQLPAKERVQRALELLAIVHMSHRVHHLPPQLSVGERQRVAIARSLANDPQVLLADEPTGNLDSKTATEILELFSRLHHEHELTLVVVTHWEKVAEYATRVIRLSDGRVVSDELRVKNQETEVKTQESGIRESGNNR